MLYKNTYSVYWEQADGPNRNWKKLQCEEQTYLCYLFRPDKLATEQWVWNVGWKDEEGVKEDKFKRLL